jgi:hypothetical protein
MFLSKRLNDQIPVHKFRLFGSSNRPQNLRTCEKECGGPWKWVISGLHLGLQIAYCILEFNLISVQTMSEVLPLL